MPAPYPFGPILAADPSNTENVAKGGEILIYAPGDSSKTPLALTDLSLGMALPNPLPVNNNGFGPAFLADLDQVAWEGGGFTGTFESYGAMRDDAKAAAADAELSRMAAERAAASAVAPTDEAVNAVLTDPASLASGAVAAAITNATAPLALKPDNGGKPVGKGELVFNVKDYGAKGDGTTDDSAAVQATFDAAKASTETSTVLFPPSATPYNVLARIRLASNIRILGHGATITKTSTTAGYAVFYSSSDGATGYGSGDSNITVEGLTFKGNFTAGMNMCAFALNHTSNLLVVGCTFVEVQGQGHTFDLLGCSGVTIRDSRFLGFNTTGGGYTKDECIQLDTSTKGSESAPNPIGSWDGLPTIDVLVDNCQFLPLTIGATKYPAPNPLGSHSIRGNAWHDRITFTNNTVVDPIVDTISGIYGALHFRCTRNLTITGNTFLNTTPQGLTAIGLYSLDRGVSSTADANISNPTTTIQPMPATNVTITGNNFLGFKSDNDKPIIDVRPESGSSNVRAQNIQISGNNFTILDGTYPSTSVSVAYADRISVDANTFKGNTRPVDVKNGRGVSITNNEAVGVRNESIYVGDSKDVRITGNKVSATSGSAIFAITSQGVSITGNTAIGNTAARVLGVRESDWFSVSGNNVQNAAAGKSIEVYTNSTNGSVRNNNVSSAVTVAGTGVTESLNTVPSTSLVADRPKRIAVIGDSLTAMSGKGQENFFNTIESYGYTRGNAYWYGVSGKGISAADSTGKTTAQNIADAKAQLGTVDLWIIALGTNNRTTSAGAVTTAVQGVLSAIGSGTKVLWVGAGIQDEADAQVVQLNVNLKSTVKAVSGATYLDWNTFIHATPDNGDRWQVDAVHMTPRGYLERSEYYGNNAYIALVA